jgi:hypothetical protein
MDSARATSVASSKRSLRPMLAKFATHFTTEVRENSERKRVEAVRAKGQRSIDAQMRQAQAEKASFAKARSSISS